MSALVEAESSNGGGARRAMAAFLVGGPLDRRLMVRAPDLWLLCPATSPLLGIVGALSMLVCPPWVLPLGVLGSPRLDSGILINLMAASVLVTVSRQGSFGHRVTPFRPWYFRYRPLLIATLPLSTFLPGYLCGLCLNRWADASAQLLSLPPAEVLTFTLLLAASFGSLLELNIRLGDHPALQFISFIFITYTLLIFIIIIFYFSHIIFIVINFIVKYEANSTYKYIISIIIVFIWMILVVRKLPDLLFIKKWVAACIILLSSGAAPGSLFVVLQPHGKILACAAAAFASLSCPLATFRILEPWVDRLAFAPLVHKATGINWQTLFRR